MMRAVIPLKINNCKTRLSSVLSASEREDLTRAMLSDIVGTLRRSGVEVDLLSTSMEPFDLDVNQIYSDYELNESLNEYLSKTAKHRAPPPSILIVMSDVPLMGEEHVRYISERPEEIVIAPGRHGGTNVLYIKNPATFEVDYYGTSFLDHQAKAKEKNLTTHTYDSFYLSCDMDEPDDLIELLIHGRGEATMLLQKWGFKVRKDHMIDLVRETP
ncbi:2-phospho-L-lactate guanylyltransferase [Methanosarcinales archaeon]|nr:MAG: 2-phospho-L-lactate guanylyltransferase [Methanosarcinales archaeon]